MSCLEIRGLCADVADVTILRGIDLTIESGQVHAIMGPNGSGKSTLSHVLMGRPGYTVTAGSVTIDGQDLLVMAPWERAQAGLFLAMQYPVEIVGVQVADVMAQAALASGRDPADLIARLEAEAESLGVPDDFLTRGLNVDMSGGEKKRSETLQMAALQPRFAVLDELDSGLDVDGLRLVARRVRRATEEFGLGVLAITHYNRLLQELRPDVVHVFVEGVISQSGGPELAVELEETGYERWMKPIETGVAIGGFGGAAPSTDSPDPFADPLL